MASSFFALFDDIATILDDVAILSKVAAKKTSGVLGDDLALNANQVAGVSADRELPVVWAVAKGSAVNKAILVPAALLISALVPWLVKPLLVIGGLFLCFEGFEKVLHSVFHKKEAAEHHIDLLQNLTQSKEALLKFESEKIKGAVRTDFILSAEIITITLGTVANQPIATQISVLSIIAILMTVGVYGLVAAIVKLDDLGLWLMQKKNSKAAIQFGRFILSFAPKFMKFLSVAGTLAMFLVGGGIITHSAEMLHHLSESFVALMDFNNSAMKAVLSSTFDGFLGLLCGSLVLLAVRLIQLLISKTRLRA